MSMRPEFISSDKTAVGEVGQKLEGQEILEEAEKEDRGSSVARSSVRAHYTSP